MDGRRLHKRFAVDDLDVQTATISSEAVAIRDISPVGISVAAPKQLGIGKEYKVKFGSGERLFATTALVKWEKPVGKGKISDREVEPLYLAGLEFVEVLTAKALPIVEFISRQIEAGDRRLRGIRFRLLSDQTVVLDHLEIYFVRIISLDGMLIETRQKLTPGSVFPMELLLGDDEMPLFFRGRIAHCNAAGNGNGARYDVGIEFVEMNELDKQRLSNFTSLIRSAQISLD